MVKGLYAANVPVAGEVVSESSAARDRFWPYAGLVSFGCAVAVAWLVRRGWKI